MRLSCIPAYGRDYKSAKAVAADFLANKDFLICDMSSPDDGRYVNAEQLAPGDTLAVRYAGKTKQTNCVKKGLKQ
jgi:hypothetical protein